MKPPIIDAIDYLQSQVQGEHDKEAIELQRGYYSVREDSEKLQNMERDYYKRSGTTPAIEAAVKAFQNFDNKKEKHMDNQNQKIANVSSIGEIKEFQVVQAAPPAQAYFPSEKDWAMMLSWGAAALKSGMLPSGIKNAEAAAIIALKGRELGVPFMVAAAHIHVINGKPSMSAEMMQTLARRNLPGLSITIIESTHLKAVVEFLRPEPGSVEYRLEFNMDDAKRAQLQGKEVWVKYPTAMLWSRAIAAGLRKVCPETLMGVSYTPEELGEEVNEEGEPIHTTGRKISGSQGQVAGLQGSPVITLKERKMLQNLAMNELKLTADEMRNLIAGLYDGKSSKELTFPEYNELYADLKAQLEEKKKLDAQPQDAEIIAPATEIKPIDEVPEPGSDLDTPEPSTSGNKWAQTEAAIKGKVKS